MLFLFCYPTRKKKLKNAQKETPKNNLKVSKPTVFTLEFLKTKRHSDPYSITKAEIFIDFIGVSGKKCHFQVEHLTNNRKVIYLDL